jgi:hypothetical protein
MITKVTNAPQKSNKNTKKSFFLNPSLIATSSQTVSLCMSATTTVCHGLISVHPFHHVSDGPCGTWDARYIVTFIIPSVRSDGFYGI